MLPYVEGIMAGSATVWRGRMRRKRAGLSGEEEREEDEEEEGIGAIASDFVVALGDKR